MSDEYADAICQLEGEIDSACNRALGALSVREIVTELRRIADGWAEEE